MGKLGPYELNTVVTGDARVLALDIPDESVDLIFTDPVYQNIDDYRWLAEMAVRVLKDGGDCIVYLATLHLHEVLAVMTPHLSYRWILTEKKISSGALIWSLYLYAHTIPAIWFTKGTPRKMSRIDFLWGTPNGKAVNHGWAKNASRCAAWLRRFSLSGDIILEPFAGGGAIIAGCKMLGRNYLAFEIDPATANDARERVANTQPPLFVHEPEQAAMAI